MFKIRQKRIFYFLIRVEKSFSKSYTGFHKVFRQFKQFIAKAVDEISYIDLFFINQCLLKFLFKLKFCVSD